MSKWNKTRISEVLQGSSNTISFISYCKSNLLLVKFEWNLEQRMNMLRFFCRQMLRPLSVDVKEDNSFIGKVSTYNNFMLAISNKFLFPYESKYETIVLPTGNKTCSSQSQWDIIKWSSTEAVPARGHCWLQLTSIGMWCLMYYVVKFSQCHIQKIHR